MTAPRVLADSWSFDSGERIFDLSGGGRVVVSVDASRSTQQPDFTLTIQDGDSPPVNHPGLWFRDIVASPDGALIVGLSNRGIPDSAAAIFARDGTLLFLARHDTGKLDYCQESVTLVREWYDGDTPDVRFGVSGDLAEITLDDCRGQQVPLLEAVGEPGMAPGQ